MSVFSPKKATFTLLFDNVETDVAVYPPKGTDTLWKVSFVVRFPSPYLSTVSTGKKDILHSEQYIFTEAYGMALCLAEMHTTNLIADLRKQEMAVWKRDTNDELSTQHTKQIEEIAEA